MVNPLFNGLPAKIQSIVDKVKAMTVIDSVKECVVNPDEKFLDLWNYCSITLNHISG